MTPVEGCVQSAKVARQFARSGRRWAITRRERVEAERHARECFARAYDYLARAKRIKAMEKDHA